MVHQFVKAPPTPSLPTRIKQAANYAIRGIKPDTWMSPLQPLRPYAPELVDARQYDYQVGRNLYYKPRGDEEHSFKELRAVAKASELVRLAIETRIDQVSAVKWSVKPKDEADAANDEDPRIKAITAFFERPDQVHDWTQWLALVLEELFVTDAVSIYRRKNRGGTLYGLEPIDGATIFPLVDQDGRQPLPPDPAYQQILKGVPKVDFTAAQLVYYVRKARVNTPYGFSPTEQVIVSAETDIERIKYTLSYFTEGSVPDAYITAPEDMGADRVQVYEAHLNGLLAGNRVGRRQMPVLIHGMELKSLKQAELKNEFDEWLARKVCFAFSLPPTAFIKQVSRANAESEKDRAQEEGLYPVLLYVKRLIDRFIAEDFGAPDLEFHWDDDEEKDPLVQAQIHCMYVKEGIEKRSEVRDELGLDDQDGADELLVDTANGPVPLPGSPMDVQMKQEQQEQQQAQAEQGQQHAMEQIQAKTPQQNATDDAAGGKGVEKRKKKADWYRSQPTHRGRGPLSPG